MLPNLSGAVAQDNDTRFRTQLVGGLRLAGFLLIPTAIAVWVWAEPLLALLFRVGRFTWADVEATGLVVRYLVPFLLAVAGANIVKRAFYALGDRVTLLVVGAGGLVMTAGLGFVLASRMGIAGLALALSLSTGVQFLAYLVVLHVRQGADSGLPNLLGPFLRMTLAALPMGVWLYALYPLGDWAAGPWKWENWAVSILGGTVGAGLYLAVAHVLGIDEMATLRSRASVWLRAR